LSDDKELKGPRILSRRDFLVAAAAVGTGIAGAKNLAAADTTSTASTTTGPLIKSASGAESAETLNVALLGVGAEGQVLMEDCLHIPGIRFKAVCDIWEYSQRYAQRYLKKFGHIVNVYEDYKEMLDHEKDLDAVIIATPDWMHAPHANACMERGLHVYCEKEMSNTLADARTMVETQRRTKQLLQIGHQRRSNPRYLHVVNDLFRNAHLLGRINHAYAQWDRSMSEDLGWPEKYTIPQATLDKYGYKNMSEFRNWRWYKKYGGGPIVDLGSHQIDIFNWVYDCKPSFVMAAGGRDYYKNHEWYDNVYAIFDYPTEQGTARALYRVLTTTKHGQFFETFMGDMGSLDISEVPNRGNWAWREEHAPSWEQWVKKGWLLEGGVPPAVAAAASKAVVDVRVSSEAAKWPLPVELAKPAHQPHLENFFDAIRKGTPLNCPAEIGYETAVTVLKVNEAVAAARKLAFTPEEFKV